VNRAGHQQRRPEHRKTGDAQQAQRGRAGDAHKHGEHGAGALALPVQLDSCRAQHEIGEKSGHD
jgi:hypothetical protein